MELMPLLESIKIYSHLKFSKNWGGPESDLTVVVVVVVVVFTLAENVKLDVLIRIRLKKVTSHSWVTNP